MATYVLIHGAGDSTALPSATPRSWPTAWRRTGPDGRSAAGADSPERRRIGTM
jgi:hypothetical protein